MILNDLEIGKGQTVLDAGCGNGYMVKRFADRVGTAGRVIALDLHNPAVDDLNNGNPYGNITALQSDITRQTPLPDSSVDLVYISTVYHIFSEEQRAGFRREVRRLLKPGGRLAVVEMEKKPTPFGPPMARRVSPRELEEAIRLEPLERKKAGGHFYMQIFRMTL